MRTQRPAVPRPRLARLFRRIVFLGMSVAVALLVFEGFVRWFDPYGVSQFVDMQRYLTGFVEELPGDPRLFRHRLGQRMEFRGFTIETNGLGLRNPELELPKPADVQRLLFLGDSVVLGWGAPEPQTFVRQAERELRLLNQPQRIECVNSGHNQFDSVQEAALLEHLLAAGVEPRAVLLVFVDNDIHPTAKVLEAYRQSLLEQQRDPPSAWGRLWGWLRAHVFRGMNSLYVYASQVTSGQNAAPAASFSAAESEGLELCRQALLRMRDACTARGIELIVLDHTLDPRLAVLEQFCREQAIRCFPFRFSEHELTLSIRRSASDPHANEFGHVLLLGKLRPALRELGYRVEDS